MKKCWRVAEHWVWWFDSTALSASYFRAGDKMSQIYLILPVIAVIVLVAYLIVKSVRLSRVEKQIEQVKKDLEFVESRITAAKTQQLWGTHNKLLCQRIALVGKIAWLEGRLKRLT